MKHPNKLKDDAILEAICDIRFDTSADIPEEVIIGWLIDLPLWENWEMKRLPNAEIPASVRRSEENLKYQPSVELRDEKNHRTARIGSNVLSLHFLNKYPGWEEIEPQIKNSIDALFKRIKGLKITRIGLRYINAFDKQRHKIDSAHDLDISVTIKDDILDSPLNLNFMKKPTDFHTVMTRVASTEFVKGDIGPNVAAIADIDVFTPSGFSEDNPNSAMEWIVDSHDLEKDAFFSLLKEETLQELKES